MKIFFIYNFKLFINVNFNVKFIYNFIFHSGNLFLTVYIHKNYNIACININIKFIYAYIGIDVFYLPFVFVSSIQIFIFYSRIYMH